MLDSDVGPSTMDWGATSGGSGGGPSLEEDAWALGQITVRGRSLMEFDAAGNPVWEWVDVFTGSATEGRETRREVDDPAGATLVKTSVTFLHPRTAADVPETAVVVDALGRMWQVESAVRAGDAYTAQISRPTTHDAEVQRDGQIAPEWW